MTSKIMQAYQQAPWRIKFRGLGGFLTSNSRALSGSRSFPKSEWAGCNSRPGTPLHE